MAGIYFHIPYCKQACHYCDFHFSTNLSTKSRLVEAIVKEISLQKDYLSEEIKTIYFGGGTPSILDEKELHLLLDSIYKNFSVAHKPEITLEANPDDLDKKKLEALHKAGINRLSIGIQSFNEDHLRYLNRSHSSEDAVSCFRQARETGFSNISLDLIYAIPYPNHSIWEKDLEIITNLNPEHISSYCLTIESGTAFGNWLKKGKINPIDDEYAAYQFELLLQTLKQKGYIQYEISNFAQPGKQSQHNSGYWKYEKYLGLGPGAHSFNGISRQFNIDNNIKYMKTLAVDQLPSTLETLDLNDQINEYILTTLRTMWGCDILKLKNEFGYDLMQQSSDYLEKLNQQEMIVYRNNHLVLTDKGKLLADQISCDLFVCES